MTHWGAGELLKRQVRGCNLKLVKDFKTSFFMGYTMIGRKMLWREGCWDVHEGKLYCQISINLKI